MAGQHIDRDKLRAAVRREGSECIFQMLDVAITLLPQAKLRKLIKGYLNPAELRPDGEGNQELAAEVEAFQKASLAGKYYQAFAVNSKNFTDTSSGTLAWIADCRRLLDRCVAQAKKEEPATVCQAFEVVFSLLDRIDAGNDDILFFADEGGSWALGVDWEKVLPAWFKVLSAGAEPADYARRVALVLTQHYKYGTAKMLAVARRIASPAQLQALPQTEEDLIQVAEVCATERRRKAVEERAAETARREREVAAAREKHLASVAGRESELWSQVHVFDFHKRAEELRPRNHAPCRSSRC